MSAWVKSGFQFLFAAAIVAVLYFGPPNLHFVGVPGRPEFVPIGWLFIPAAILIIIGFSNAVNLTDGLDSLAGSISSVSFASYGLIAYLQGQTYLAAFCFTVVGALFAFLWFNAYPAQLFMGDTGSLALGATLALVRADDRPVAAAAGGGVRVRSGNDLGTAAGGVGQVQPPLPGA